ncbi:MAG: helix-hairpin-helix domain-containing protein [Bacillus sp. (in: firmicutes)]
MSKVPKLPLTVEEKACLRKAKWTLADIHRLDSSLLQEKAGMSGKRAKYVKALAEFQTVPSIGPRLAEKMIHYLNVYSLEDMKDRDGAALFDTLEKEMGVWTDGCVEDQIRCVINYANNPASNKSWPDFTEERKQYRSKNGYPADRPIKPWHEVEQEKKKQ